MSGFNINNFKKNNREGLFNKLKNWGYAFHKINYKKERVIKINKLLNEGLLGWTHSSELKIDNEIIKEIFDWNNDIIKTFIQITNEYDKYFYTKEEILEYYSNRSDINDIEKVLDSIYPDLKVRKIQKNKSYFAVLIGSGIVSYLVEKKDIDTKKISIYAYFLTKNKHMYSSSMYGLALKYKKHLKGYYKHPIYTLSLKSLKNIYKKLKTIK